MVDMKLSTSLDRANLVVVVISIENSLAVVRSLCGVKVKHAVDVHCKKIPGNSQTLTEYFV